MGKVPVTEQRQFGPLIKGWQVPPAPDVMRLDGRWARLERLNPDAHAEDLFAANSQDERIWDYLPYGPFADLASYRDWVAGWSQKTDPWFMAIIDRQTGRAGGVASYLRITPDVGVIEVGHINLAPVLQGSRTATEAMFLMMEWVFAAGYRRYEWKCDAFNLPSRRAAARLGFSFEGIFRQATIVKGRNRDTAWFAMTDSDWPALRAAFAGWLAPENFTQTGQQKTALSDMTRPCLVNADPALAGPV
ncbi:MAG: GNAT family protein [Paracoccaceae bacterium]